MGFRKFLLASLILVLALPISVSFAQVNAPPAITYSTLPKPIWQTPPIYPRLAQRRGREGWALLGFTIEIDGSVSGVTVLDSYGDDKFGSSSVKAMQQWTYKPATLNGEKIRLCNREQLVTFRIKDQKGARRTFIRKYKKAMEHIRNRQLDEAQFMTKELSQIDDLNLYELPYVNVALGMLAEMKGDTVSALRSYSRAVRADGAYLEKDAYRAVLRHYFASLVSSKRFSNALNAYNTIDESEKLKSDDPIAKAAKEIEALKFSGEAFVVPVEIDEDCNCGDDQPLFHYELLRREIGIRNLNGSLSKLKMSCDATTATTEYEPGWTWRAPASWGDCSVMFYGEPGTTFQIVEY